MKKKIFTAILCCMTLWSGISAQETVSAFKHVSVGVEVGTAGAGLEIATSLSSNFALRGGISKFPYNYKTAFNGTVNENILNRIDSEIGANPAIATALSQKGLPTNARSISTTVDVTGSINLFNGKLLLDYYPWAKSSFHLTGGLYIGAGEIIKLKGRMDEAVAVLEVLKDNGVDLLGEPYIKNDNKGYQLTGRDIMDVRGAIKTNSIKPYFGLGFGRAVPKKRIGLSVEIGALYHGTPKITSENQNVQKLIDDELSDVAEIIKDIPIYPVLSLKLNIRLF